MNVAEKLALAKKHINNIATHDDADPQQVLEALSELQMYIGREAKELFDLRPDRIAAVEAGRAERAKLREQNAKAGEA